MSDHPKLSRRTFLAATGAGVVGAAGIAIAPPAAAATWSNPAMGRISSGYKTPARPNHAGTDIANSQGTSLYAASGGTVAAIRTNSYPGDSRTGRLPYRRGNGVIINHAGSYRTYYGHMYTVGVSVGQSVSAGQYIGTIGQTGNATGPHVHFEVHVNGATTNPYTFMSARGITLGSTPPSSGGGGWPRLTSPTSSEVARVAQYLLRYRGYSLEADGYYGPVTADAVRSFQQSQGLVVDGILGPVTWPELTWDCQRGSAGNHVRGAQTGLNRHGAGLLVDGEFGSVTVSAVRSFQSDNGLVVDGWVGDITWSHLV